MNQALTLISPSPALLLPGQVILGWDKAVATMRKGEKADVRIAPDYAYGNSGVGPIPGGSTLLFEIELLGWRRWGPVPCPALPCPAYTCTY